jgi:hypothetical protein
MVGNLRWSADDDSFLRFNADTMTDEQLAQRLNRTVAAVAERRKRFTDSRPARPWSPEDIQFLTDNLATMTHHDIAAHLDRSHLSVANRVHDLKHGSTEFVPYRRASLEEWAQDKSEAVKAAVRTRLGDDGGTAAAITEETDEYIQRIFPDE